MDARHLTDSGIARADLNGLTRPVLSSASFFGRSLANRAVVAPMSRVSAAEGGLATKRMQEYYGAFARGGFAVVITEGTYTDTAASQGYDRQPGIATERQAQAWRPIANELRKAGTVAIMQLMHAGALSQRTGAKVRTIAPSRVQPRGRMMTEYGGSGPYRLPSEMTEGDIWSVSEGFAQAARHALLAGFDGIEIHAANGYLLDQFNTTYTNQRTDRYGVTPENRIRLTAQIVERIRAASPDDFIVGVRLSEAKVNDFGYRWPGEQVEAATIFTRLASAGASYFHLAGEGRGFRDAVQTMTEPFTTLARRLTGLPVIANGGLGDPDVADEVIRGGHADLVAIGRTALANPDWPGRVELGSAIAPFNPEMISPSASIDNSDHWLKSRGEAA